ncbi:MAG TPA: hypothetical protein VIK53_00940 [Verrucomicrobiae bacterium]
MALLSEVPPVWPFEEFVGSLWPPTVVNIVIKMAKVIAALNCEFVVFFIVVLLLIEWLILFHDSDFAPGKIIFQAFSLRDKLQTRISPINKNLICAKSGRATRRTIYHIRGGQRTARPTFAAYASFARQFSFNLCRRRFVLKFSCEQTGKAA